jgi:hypothetical protein
VEVGWHGSQASTNLGIDLYPSRFDQSAARYAGVPLVLRIDT